jgi:hypothetical protein
VNPQYPLAALNPLREPAFIGWWPLAPGWWVLIALFFVAITLLCYFLYKRHKNNAYRRLALLQLKEINTELETGDAGGTNAQKVLTATNALLKAVALRVFPRHDIAALSGTAWLDFLNATAGNSTDTASFPTQFATAAYQKHNLDLDMQQISVATENWIKTHKAPHD